MEVFDENVLLFFLFFVDNNSMLFGKILINNFENKINDVVVKFGWFESEVEVISIVVNCWKFLVLIKFKMNRI